jgi:DNA modification methylase
MKKSDAWPAFNVERREVSALKPYRNNARTHSAEQVEQIANSIREWGWTQPVLVDERGGVLAGHGRLEAAKTIGVTEVPVIVAKGWSKAQKRAYVLADNQLAMNAGWDRDLLKVELGALQDVFDTSLLGFGDDFLADVMADRTAGLTDPDEAPAVGVHAVTRKGDVWLCGSHRLLCGDATDAADVEHLLAGVKPHLMVTDPPYGVEYDANWRNEADRANGKPYGASAIGKVNNDERADWREAWALFPGAIAYVWHADRHASIVQGSLEAAGFDIRCQIIWAKTRFAISRGDYHWQHEPCWYAVRKNARGNWTGNRSQTTLWTIEHQKSETGHSTQKPVECMRRPIVNNSSPGQAVYDPFVGSGTTMIAAEMEGRHSYCMELSEVYCDVVVKRWQAFTGKQATLDGDGRTFEEISDERYDSAKDSAARYEVAIEAKRKRLEAAE